MAGSVRKDAYLIQTRLLSTGSPQDGLIQRVCVGAANAARPSRCPGPSAPVLVHPQLCSRRIVTALPHSHTSRMLQLTHAQELRERRVPDKH